MIFRRKGSWLKQIAADGKIISARQITQKEYKDKTIEWVTESFRKFDYSKLSIEKLIEIGKIMGIRYPQLEELK